VSAPVRRAASEPDELRRRGEFVEWCIRHVGLPWAMILSGVAAGLTYHGSLGSGRFALWIFAFEAAGVCIGIGGAALAGRILWRIGIGRHFSAED
jgi:hypothetical protein